MMRIPAKFCQVFQMLSGFLFPYFLFPYFPFSFNAKNSSTDEVI